MSQTGPTWSDVVNNFISAIQTVLNEIGAFIKDHAGIIADVVMGIGLAYGVYQLAKRVFPGLGRVLGVFSF